MKTYIKALLLPAVILLGGWQSRTPSYVPIGVTLFPESFAAVGNGSHDDTNAFKNMRSACPAANCIMVLAAKHYILTDQWDAGSTTTSNAVGYSVAGQGYGATWLDFRFTTAKDSCIRLLNTPLFQLTGVRITCNSHATYAVSHQLSSTSAENQTLDHVRIEANGAAYGWAIGPNTNADIAHVNGYDVTVTGAATSDVLSGNGAQGNVLDNNCYGCSFDSSLGDGVQIKGGGFSMFGGAFDDNAGVDFNLVGPPSQPVVISGVRSENSAQFFKNAGGGTYVIPSVTLIGNIWNAKPSSPNTCSPPGITAGPCAMSVTSSIPINIIGGLYFGNGADNVQMAFSSGNPANPISVTMQGVGVDNANWAASLNALAKSPNVLLHSSGDIYAKPDFTANPGSSHVYDSASPVNTSAGFQSDGSNATWAGNVAAGGTFSNPAGGFGPYSNKALYSAFDGSSLGSTWAEYCDLAAGTLTANTGDLLAPDGTHTAFKYVQSSTPNPGCGGGAGAIYQQITTLTPSAQYSVCGWFNTNGGSIPFVQFGFDTTGAFAGSSSSFVIPADTNWHFLGPLQFTIPSSSWPGTFSGVSFSPNGISHTLYAWGVQVVKGSSCGLYAHTTSTAVSGLGFLDASGNPISSTQIPNIQITTGTTLIAANTCTGYTAASMPGATTLTAIIPPTPTSTTSAITGWGSSGGLVFSYKPTADTFNWAVCNVTASSITPGASVTWNVGAR
jgi:hypothetical protein